MIFLNQQMFLKIWSSLQDSGRVNLKSKNQFLFLKTHKGKKGATFALIKRRLKAGK